MFDLSFRDGGDGQETRIDISLGHHDEAFFCDLTTWSPADYERQWRGALDLLLHARRTIALYTSLELAPEGWGRLWLLNVIPEDDAIPRRAPVGDGVFVTQRLLHVTRDPAAFLQRIPLLEGQEQVTSPFDEISFYILDPACPERLFRYLSGHVGGISNWHITTPEVDAFARKLGAKT